MSQANQTKITRRRALVWGGAALGAGALGAGGYGVHQAKARGYILRTPEGAPQPLPDRRVERPGGLPAMVIARGKDPAANVRAALERFGGIAQCVRPGDVVVVKPWSGWPR